MKKRFSVLALASLFVAGTAMGSAYRIPEQSLDSTAKAGANVASADSVDVTYYNPAGMSRLPNAWQVEGTATYLHLPAIDYDDARSPRLSGTSNTEDFLLPTFFAVSPDYNNFRFGISLTEPFGLEKHWDDGYPKAFAEKYNLKVFELNPTFSYKFNDMVSVGGGVRVLYSEATLMNNGRDIGTPVGLKVKGDTTEFGYNLALDVKPMDDLVLAVTYRSHVDLDFEGNALIAMMGIPILNSGGEVSVAAPAVLTFSAAYTYADWTFDLTVDQTYWSEYEVLDLEFDRPLPGALAIYDAPRPRNYDDAIAIRLGVEYRLNPKVTLMGGIAYDETPIPEETVGFDLPDSDAWLFSVGVRYKCSEQLEYGIGLLYDYKEDREVRNDVAFGEFSGSSAYLVSLGLTYRF